MSGDTDLVPPALASVARRLGVSTFYVDVDGVRREVAAHTVDAVCELLDEGSGGRRDVMGERSPLPVGDVVVVRGGRIHSGLHHVTDDPVHLELTLEDGTRLQSHSTTLPGATSLGSTSISASSVIEAAPGVPFGELPLGIHSLVWSTSTHHGKSGPEHESSVVVSPASFPQRRTRRPGTAVFAPAYALWSRVATLPDFDMLAALGAVMAELGVDCVATLPLHAPGMGSLFNPSPYSPVSRFHLNELLVGERFLGRPDSSLEERGSVDRVDWDEVLAVRTRLLTEFTRSVRGTTRAELNRFLAERPEVSAYAEFCASAGSAPARVHEVGQWLAHRALGAVSDDLCSRGQRLALDLPVGSRADGWECTTWPDLFVGGATMGAPPDSFFVEGQNWGLPPVHPLVSRHHGHRMWRDLLANACRFAGVLRIDHVMQVHRLWWVPEGLDASQGTYVQYPADELLAVAAMVAERSGTSMIGEDLGTVPAQVRELMADWGLPGMHEEAFALQEMAHGGATTLPVIPAGSWVGIRTHDMAPLAKVANDEDTRPYSRALEADLGHAVGPDVESLAAAMLERLRSSSAQEVVVDLDDVLGCDIAHNVPGTVGPHNWSHRCPVPVEDIAGDSRLRRMLVAETTPR